MYALEELDAFVGLFELLCDMSAPLPATSRPRCHRTLSISCCSFRAAIVRAACWRRLFVAQPCWRYVAMPQSARFQDVVSGRKRLFEYEWVRRRHQRVLAIGLRSGDPLYCLAKSREAHVLPEPCLPIFSQSLGTVRTKCGHSVSHFLAIIHFFFSVIQTLLFIVFACDNWSFSFHVASLHCLPLPASPFKLSCRPSPVFHKGQRVTGP